MNRKHMCVLCVCLSPCCSIFVLLCCEDFREQLIACVTKRKRKQKVQSTFCCRRIRFFFFCRDCFSLPSFPHQPIPPLRSRPPPHPRPPPRCRARGSPPPPRCAAGRRSRSPPFLKKKEMVGVVVGGVVVGGVVVGERDETDDTYMQYVYIYHDTHDMGKQNIRTGQSK